MKNKIITFILIIVIAVLSYILLVNNNKQIDNIEEVLAVPEVIKIPDRVEEVEISEGATYGELMTINGIDYETAMKIYEASSDVYDLVKIRCGRCLKLIYDKDTDELKELTYKIDSEDELHVKRRNVDVSPSDDNSTTTEDILGQYTWQAEIIPIPYEVKIKTSEGVVETSMYEAALKENIDIRAIIELANAFQWTIDFAMDPRVGDTFKFVYEERYLDGEYVMPGKILAGKYVNEGEEYYVYYFKENEDNIGYFDENGNSVQKMFLKAPVEFRYISSGYTTGPRYLAAFKMYTPTHMAIDYAAAIGTPIRAVGDGTVVSAGWNSQGYGNRISVRHNSTYTTNYAHLSQILVKYGQKVKQGDIIGKVGSTGLSTGPHLHYEMVKYGVKINPLKEVLPPGEAIKEENLERYFEEIEQLQEMLK